MPQVDLTKWREAKPSRAVYADIPDEELLKAIYNKSYSDAMPWDDFVQAMGRKYGFTRLRGGAERSYALLPEEILKPVDVYGPQEMSKEERAAYAETILQGTIPPPGYDVDPRTRELIEREDIKWYDPLRGVGKLIEAPLTIPAAAIVYPEGIPRLMGEIVEGVGTSVLTVLKASPTLTGGVPNPLYDPRASRDLLRDPAGHLVMAFGIPYGTFRLARAHIGAVRTTIAAAETPGIKPAERARLRAVADRELGKIEGGEETVQVPHLEEKIAAPPEDAPYPLHEPVKAPAQALGNPKILDRFETARQRYLDIVRGDHEIEVRKSGKREFRPLANGKERLFVLMDTKQAPLERVVLHKNGDVTLRMGAGEKQRIYKITRLEKEGEIVNRRVETPKMAELPKAQTRKISELYFADPVVMKAGEFFDNVVQSANQLADHTVRAAESVLRGDEAKLLHEDFKNAQEYGGVLNSYFAKKMHDAKIHRLTTNEAVNLTAFREGLAEPLNYRVSQAEFLVDSMLKEAFQKIKEAGLKVVEEKFVRTKTGKLRIQRIWREPHEIPNFVPRTVQGKIAHDVFRNANKILGELKDMKEKGTPEARLSHIVNEWVRNRDPLLNDALYDALQMEIARGTSALKALENVQRWVGEDLFRPATWEHARTQKFPDYFYEKDIRVILPKYFASLARRYGETKVWGWKNKGLIERLRKITETDIDEGKMARGIAEIFTGDAEISKRWPEPMQKGIDWLMEYEIWSKIYAGTAAIPNALQFSISTIPIMGVSRFVRALGKTAVDPQFRQLVSETSPLYTMTRAVQIFGGYDPRMGWLRSTLDRHLQKHPFNIFNRMQSYLSAATGEIWIRDLYGVANTPGSLRRGYAIRQLRKLDIDPRLPLTDEIVQRKMFRCAVNTQLLRDILKDPLYASHPKYRAFFLFQRFGYKQFRLFKEHVAGEVLHGNVMPLIRAAALGYLGGELVIYAKDRLREGVEGLMSLISQGDFEYIPRYRTDEITDWKSFIIHAANNYAAIGTMGFFTDIFRINNPQQAEAPPDVANFLTRNVMFLATPVFARELFVNPGMAYDNFVKRWRDRGFKAAVDQLEMGALRGIGSLPRYAAGAVTDLERDYIFELRKAIENDNVDAFSRTLQIAAHRGFNPADLSKKAFDEYKRGESYKLNRDFRIFEYNAQKEIRKEMGEK